MWTVLGLLITVASVLAGPAPDVGHRIIGGSHTTIDQYPYAAAILFEFSPNLWAQNCGGAILNEKSILSAAHCYLDDRADPRRIRVRVGSTFASNGGQVHNAVRIINHPLYEFFVGPDHDISIVHLATFIQLNSLVQLGRIAGPNYPLAENDEIWSVGWGLTSSMPPPTPSEQLKHVAQRVITRERCQSHFSPLPITDAIVCIATDAAEGICTGDSGGPNMHNHVIIGVTAFGPIECGSAGAPDGLTRVSSYNSWILANVAS